MWGFPLEEGRPMWLPCALVPSASDSALNPVLASSPNTAPNEGIGTNVLGLVCMLALRALAGGPDLGGRLPVLRGQRGGFGAW